MTNVNNWAKTEWCYYPWCSPKGGDRLYTQVRLVEPSNSTLHMQVRLVAYNTTNLRILWEIKSDGISATNFTASTEASVDKGVVNVKSDIVEKYWQSSGVSAEWIQWDAGSGEVISLDTFAAIANNLTSSATVILRGSGGQSDSAPGDWTVVPVYATLQMPDDPDEDNLIWISPNSPSASYRHWRLEIADSTNPDGFLRIGRLVAGSALIFNGENCLDQIDYSELAFKDELQLNGFTTISNNRALKKQLRLSFKNLDTAGKFNYKLLKRYLRYNRDTLKALVIVDPSDEDVKYKFSLFSKLKQTPNETHNFIARDTAYTMFDLQFDEGR